ncbi:MAG: LuxR C-terminal-related transcriptional regulator [Chloroflexota bacterium]
MNPILLTKVRPPRLPHSYIVRERLIDQLNDGRRGKLTLIHAPAGYGKTTLATAWVAAQQQLSAETGKEAATAWLTVEAFDNDPIRFLTYFIGAWQQVDPEFGSSITTALQSGHITSQTTELYGALNQLINQLIDHPASLTLVLDDWHTVENETVQHLIQYWIEHVPSHIHTIITSRALPQMPLARWRARGQLTVIDAPVLQFTVPEVGQFLREGIKLNLTDADITELTDKTEGWIGVLQLMALSLQGSEDLDRQLAQLTHHDRYLVSYLTDEVLSQQPIELRQFLTETSILNRFNAALCDAITGQSDSRLMLNDIEQRNLFVSALEGQGDWYRYHPLLSGYLRQQLATTHPDDYKTLHARAFTWLLNAGFIEEAIEHGLEAQQYDDVAQALADPANDYSWCNARAVSLLGWRKRLPEDVIAQHPKVMLAFGWAITSQLGFDELGNYLQRLRPNKSENSASIETNSALAILEAEVDLYRGDIDGAIGRLVSVDIDQLPNRSQRGMGYQVQGYAQFVNGNAQAAIDSLQTSRRLLDQPSDLAWWSYASRDLAEAYMIQGALNAAETICRETVASLPPEQHLTNPMLDMAWNTYSKVQFERNQLNEAFDYIQRSLAITRAARRNRVIRRAGLEMLARIRQAQGEWADTVKLLAQIEALIVQPPNPRMHFQTETLKAHLHLLQNKQDEVTVWAASFTPERPHFVPRLHYHTAQLVYARWLLYRDPAASLTFLTPCQAQAEIEGWFENQLAAAILQATACQRLGQTQAALDHLRVALRLARPGGYLRVFVEQAVDLAPLLRDLAREGDADPFIGTIQAVFLPTGAAVQPLIEPLTQREVEILQLIGAGLSNPQIAERLIIATGTVAYHTNNIFGKLDVRNRTEATLQARRLGLI